MEFLKFNPELDFALLLLVPLIPVVGYTIQIAFRGRLPWGDKLLTGGMFVVMCITVLEAAKALYATQGGGEFLRHSSEAGMEFKWLYTGAGVEAYNNIVAGILFDPLGAVMLAVVGIVSFFVHLFSQGYMHGDKRYNIFFANISLFTFAMLGLVLSDNILFLFIFWEIMGLMSYLLIGHFSHDPSQPFFHKWATWASKKAFLTTRVGDVCLLVGILIFYREFNAFYATSAAAQAALPEFHTLRFTHMWEMSRMVVEANGGLFPTWMTVGGLFAIGGTVGKSAQFPLHIWLPDAMAGPTPVSAMIHAATMVAAGVFLLGRLYPLLSPEVLIAVTIFGSVTAIFAATIGMTVYDLKAVLAYSTISQLGFMVAAVGLGGVVAGMFHMVTHAFFKACLFLSAGSVIHGCHHVQDMRVMGGLRKMMPITFAATLVSTLAIAGFPFFSGFYSKDAILLSAWANILQDTGNPWGTFALVCLAVGAMFTAFYMFRLIFMTFFGEYRGNMKEHRYSAQLAAEGFEGPEPHGHDDDHGHDDHGHDDHAHVPHESPLNIVISISVLAAIGLPGLALLLYKGIGQLVTVEGMYGSAVGGWIVSGLPTALQNHDANNELYHHSHSYALYVSLVVASLGIVGAWFLYGFKRDLPGKIVPKLGPLYTLVRRRYFVDEFADGTVIRLQGVFAATMKWIDEHLVDGLVLLVGRIHDLCGVLSAWIDRTFVDGLVNLVGAVTQVFGAAFRLLQTGRIQQYAGFAVAGGLLAAAWLILS
jgi:proton-translocating NADH-quinone oxidoreductase chain L